jgi:predicted DNA-binding transcriptional regulator YafY
MDRNFYELIKHNYYMEDHIIVEDTGHLTVELRTDSEDLVLELALKNPAMVKLLAPDNTRERLKSLTQELERIYG